MTGAFTGSGESLDEPVGTELVREDGQKVEFAVPLRKAAGAAVSVDAASAFKAQMKAASGSASDGSSKASSGQKRKKSALELIKEEEEAKKLAKLQRLEAEVGARAQRRDYWLTPGIVVKVVNKKVRIHILATPISLQFANMPTYRSERASTTRLRGL